MKSHPDLCPVCYNMVHDSKVCPFMDKHRRYFHFTYLPVFGYKMVFENYQVHIKGHEISIIRSYADDEFYKPRSVILETQISDWEDLKHWNSDKKIEQFVQNFNILK